MADMDDDTVNEAKNYLLGKGNFMLKCNESSMKFFMRFNKTNRTECKKFIDQIGDYITELMDDSKYAKYMYYFDNPYGDSVMLFEVRANSDIMKSIKGRWDYLKEFTNVKEEV